MAIEYDMYKVKDVNDSNNDGLLRARVVSKGTITTEQLLDYVAVTNGYNHGQAKGVLTALEDAILTHLSKGYNVQLGDLGYFSVSVTSRLVKSKKELRAESVIFKGLNFRANAGIKRMFKYIQIVRAGDPRKVSSDRSREQCAQILKKHLEEKVCITRAEYCRITGILKSRAMQDIHSFIEEGWLKKYGSGRTVVYILAPKRQEED